MPDINQMFRDLVREQQALRKELKRLQDVVSKAQDADVRLHLGRTQRLAIAAGVITPTAHSYFRVAAETGTADELDTITPTHAGHIIVLGTVAEVHTITIKHATGNIQLAGSDIVLDTAYKNVVLLFYGGPQQWILAPNY